MADTAKKVKFNIWVFLCYTLSVAFSYACYFVYAYLPLSEEFTNSIEYSGQETVAAFGSSFAAGILSAVIFIVMAFVFRKYFYRLSESDSKIGKRKIKGAALEWIALVSSVLLFAVLIVSAVLSFLYFKKCNDMRYPFLLLFLVNIIADIVNCRAFVAPEDDRKQREINAKYRITLGLIMSLSWVKNLNLLQMLKLLQFILKKNWALKKEMFTLFSHPQMQKV